MKYLGILIVPDLNWKFHVDDLSIKLSRTVGMLDKIRHYVNQRTLNMIYHGIFSSLLLYGSQKHPYIHFKNGEIAKQSIVDYQF